MNTDKYPDFNNSTDNNENPTYGMNNSSYVTENPSYGNQTPSGEEEVMVEENKEVKTPWWISVIYIVVVFTGVFLFSFMMDMSQVTFVNFWYVAIGCLILAAVSCFWLTKYWSMMMKRHKAICFLANLAFMTVLFGSVFYFCNSHWAVEPKMNEMTVTSRYEMTHHRRRGGTYTDYHFRLNYPDGREVAVEVPLTLYNEFSEGSRVNLPSAKGLFGFTVIYPYHITPWQPEQAD